jgi:hypothetical protein
MTLGPAVPLAVVLAVAAGEVIRTTAGPGAAG